MTARWARAVGVGVMAWTCVAACVAIGAENAGQVASLEGSAMRRLRQTVHHHGRSGSRTAEYAIGSDPGTDAVIVALIEDWASHKKHVGPYVAHFRRVRVLFPLEPQDDLKAGCGYILAR